MAHATCEHCGVTIGDHETMVERDGKTFCCNNCASSLTAQTSQAAMGTCAHCQIPIVDPSTRVERNGEMFCCSNCAAAMPAGAGHHQR